MSSYVYKQINHSRVIDEKLENHVCSNGKLLQISCFISGTINESLPDDHLANISLEIVRDMKASFFLAMSGHYRQAILIQRCVFENFLYGLFFHSERYYFRNANIENVDKAFKSWANGEHNKKSISYLLEIIERDGLISSEESKKWKDMYAQLSRFVHTILHTPIGQKIKYGGAMGKEFSFLCEDLCEAEVEFNKENLIEWSNYFQQILFLVLYKLIILYPLVKKEEAGRLALSYLRAEFKDAETTINDSYLSKLLKMRSSTSVKTSKV